MTLYGTYSSSLQQRHRGEHDRNRDRRSRRIGQRRRSLDTKWR
jgi:hypothetical protein